MCDLVIFIKPMIALIAPTITNKNVIVIVIARTFPRSPHSDYTLALSLTTKNLNYVVT